MREFKTSCIDKVTGMEMVLSECSYNQAVDWLYSKGFTDYERFEPSIDWVCIEFVKPAKRTFVYDENRGYLLAN